MVLMFSFRAIFILLVLLIVAGVAASHAADTAGVAMTATIVSKGNCSFKTTGPVNLNFGNLNPMYPVDRTETATPGNITFTCKGKDTVYAISDDDGLNESAPNVHRLRHSTDATAFIPYAFSYTPTSGTAPKNTDITLTVSATIQGADYQDALVGIYTDTVTISIQP